MKLKEYIRGNRKGKEAHRIERDALKDPFLYEALEGFDDVSEDHVKRIEDLQKLITKTANPVRRSWLQWSAAASILLLVSFGGYLLLTDREKDIEPLLSQNIDIKTPEYPTKETVQTEHTQQAELANDHSEQEEFTQGRSKAIARNSQDKLVQPTTVVVPILSDVILAEQVAALAEIQVVADTAEVTLSDKLRVLASADNKNITKDSGITTIGGRITDQYGEPLMGVYIMQKGTTIGTSSNVDGRFEMKLDSIKNLYISSIGYLAQEISATQLSNSMNIALLEDKTALAEAVVVAASGAQRRSNTASAVTQVDIKESEPVIGRKAYEQYLKDNMIHPTNEQDKKVKGKVTLSFYIDSQGRPIDITIEKSLNDAADAEAIRLIKEGADWTLSNKRIEWIISF